MKVLQISGLCHHYVALCFILLVVHTSTQLTSALPVLHRILSNCISEDVEKLATTYRNRTETIEIKSVSKTEESNEICTKSTRKSKKMKNSGSYCGFVFNDVFETTNRNGDLASRSGHRRVGSIKRKVLANEAIDTAEQYIWDQVAESLLNAYDDDTGAIFYNIRKLRWQICTQATILFPKNSVVQVLNICVSLPIALNGIILPNVTRTPVDLEDYISDTAIEKKKAEAITDCDDDDNTRTRSRARRRRNRYIIASLAEVENRKVNASVRTNAENSVFVNLLTDSSSYYSTNCKLKMN